jgi:hypothetical protein
LNPATTAIIQKYTRICFEFMRLFVARIGVGQIFSGEITLRHSEECPYSFSFVAIEDNVKRFATVVAFTTIILREQFFVQFQKLCVKLVGVRADLQECPELVVPVFKPLGLGFYFGWPKHCILRSLTSINDFSVRIVYFRESGCNFPRICYNYKYEQREASYALRRARFSVAPPPAAVPP